MTNGSTALCVNCAAGYYSDSSGFYRSNAYASNATCINCPAGRGSEPGAINCTACAAGEYSTGDGPCLSCPSSKFSKEESSQCIALSSCPANSYCSGASIVSCPSGTVSSIGSSSNVACTPVLHATSSDDSSVSVGWSQLSGVDMYQVATKVAAGTWTATNVTSTSTTFTLNSVAQNTLVQVSHHPHMYVIATLSF